ncbi:MAG: mechanosensitive ion channel family protein [Endomicrobiaceae bacterium]|nr:mechanosensitive ion channel family protein [Endomicrobiaceae bacterium]
MFNNLIGKVVFQNTVGEYLFSIALFIFLIILIYVVRIIVMNRLEKWASTTKTTIDDFIIEHAKKTLTPLLILGSFIVSIQNLIIIPDITKIIYILGIILLIAMSLKFVMSLLDYLMSVYFKKNNTNETRQRSLKWVIIAIKIVITCIALIILLDNMGIKISALVAGLGIGGIAIAFASQAVLGDLFSFFVILFDRPFEIGDFIIVDDLMGTVENVGIKTTRVRSLGGEELIFSNTSLTNARVRNYKRMARRRVVFKLGVTYQTSLENIKEIPEIIKKIISSESEILFDRAHFASYGDFALIYEVVYNVLNSDYNKYMDVQQSINFKIKEEFDKHKIDFAYPTQTLFINKLI